MTTAITTSSRRRRLRSILWRWRPALVALLVAVAAWSALGALRPAPPPSVDLVVATADLPAGHLLADADVGTVSIPVSAAPAAALRLGADAVGHRLAHPAGRGVPLVPSDLVDGGAWSFAEDGELVVPIRLADPAVPDLLPTATPLHLVSATGAGSTLLTDRARLVAAVREETTTSVLGGGEHSGTLLLLAVPQEVATLVLDASAGGSLTVALGTGD
ncbi:hypothetical protein C8046_16170 [Serinibacter arcticus]|uniref:SAF domain-containing protein n=1 Tax=Serinibacter arcticus TaxID=1655435 RepID=A0A2U1ZYF1_9MICO|nr:SAF domain-containing protein [Serinibacter arcticus]PWD51953.1 hypothetical protein C8046_16170 [Serinibacter arcticus]